jgi:hypothetical protein
MTADLKDLVIATIEGHPERFTSPHDLMCYLTKEANWSLEAAVLLKRLVFRMFVEGSVGYDPTLSYLCVAPKNQIQTKESPEVNKTKIDQGVVKHHETKPRYDFGEAVRDCLRRCASEVAASGVNHFDLTRVFFHDNRVKHFVLCDFYDMLLKDYGHTHHFMLVFSENKLRVENILGAPKAQDLPDEMLQGHRGHLVSDIRAKIADNLIWKRFGAEYNFLDLNVCFPCMPRLERAALCAKLFEWVKAEKAESLYYAHFMRHPNNPHILYWTLVDPTTVEK